MANNTMYIENINGHVNVNIGENRGWPSAI